MEVINIKYTPDPIYHPRMIKPGDDEVKLESGKTLEEDKIEFPSIFDNEFSVIVKTEKEKFSFYIPARYCWKANIMAKSMYLFQKLGRSSEWKF